MNAVFQQSWGRMLWPALLAGALVLTGCASKKPSDGPDSEAFASRLIANKVAVAADAQREYVAIVNEDAALKARKQASLETDEVDVDYIGKPQELLQTFAHRYGYRYVESGAQRRLKNINVRVQRVPPIEVLRNIGYQVDAMADVSLDKNEKVIRLVFKPQEQHEGR